MAGKIISYLSLGAILKSIRCAHETVKEFVPRREKKNISFEFDRFATPS